MEESMVGSMRVYLWERASREAKVEDQGLTCKGMVAVGDTGCEAH